MDNKKTKPSIRWTYHSQLFNGQKYPQRTKKLLLSFYAVYENAKADHQCSVLSPIGAYRSNHITPSKGKRSKKRKRRDSKPGDEKSSENPPPPEISPFIITGLNNTHRILEESSKKALETKEPLVSQDPETRPQNDKTPTPNSQSPPQTHFLAIFIARSDQSSILTSHLPQIIATASKAYPTKPLTKLVQLPKGSESRIAAALGIPRVTVLGILDDAPHSEALIDVLRDSVEDIEIPWLDEAKKAVFLETRINSIQTFIGPVKAK